MARAGVFSIRRSQSMDKLTDQELLQLEKYRFKPTLDNSFCLGNLLDESYLKEFLEKLTLTIDAPSEKIAASIFMKRYAFLAVMSLYAMTKWNKKLNVSLDNIKMEQAEVGENWLPFLSLKDCTVQEWDPKEDRSTWRNTVIKDLFTDNIYPLISQLEKNAGISKLILWENISVYIYWLYESELKDHDNQQVSSDFRYLIFEVEGSLFGRFNRNPLQKFFADKTYMEEWDEEIRIRKTCCFSYHLPAGKRCKTCPCTHISKDGRCQVGESVCSTIRSFA
jgi:siderophore-iron reductase FhuF